jgi:hypothetical protein
VSATKALPCAAIAVVCAIAAVHAHATRSATVPGTVVAAAPATEALGLKPGDRIAGWKVRALVGSPDTELRIELEHAEVRFAITVTPLGARPENPPSQSQHHAIYYGHAQPAGTRIPDGAVRAITADIARRLDKTQ